MSARDEAIGRLAKAAAKIADDWGWKGAKKGEMDASQYIAFVNSPDNDDYVAASRQMGRWLDSMRKGKLGKRMQKYEATYGNNPHEWTDPDNLMFDIGEDLAKGLANLQNADIPREWTGKVWRALSDRDTTAFPYVAQHVSDLMRPMTHEQRLSFLRLIETDNTGASLDTLASLVKRLYKRPS